MAKEPPTTTAIDTVRANWTIGTARSQSRDLYALALVDIGWSSGGSIFSLSDAAAKSASDLGLDGPIEFVFSMAPKSLDLDEPAAVSVLPTQDGGQFVEHQGCINRTIAITGTTGFRPNRKNNVSVIPVLGIANPFGSPPEADPLSGLPRGETSGFEDLLLLRNLFRRYYDCKRDPDLSHRVVMVWQNAKEGEFWVVEPLSFRTRRDSGSPLTSSYDIQLRTIEKVEFLMVRSPDDRLYSTGLLGLNERLKELTNRMANDIRKVENLLDNTIGLAQQTINNVLGPGTAIVTGLANIVATGSRVFDVPRNSVAGFVTACDEMTRALETSQARMSAYRANGGITPSVTLKGAIARMRRSASRLFSEDSIFVDVRDHRYARRKAAFATETVKTRSGGSPTHIANARPPGGTKIGVIGAPDTIYTLAQRYLGDQGRWKELVVLNDLRQPYISASGDGQTVLRPGDKILLPAAAQTAGGVVPDRKRTDLLTERMGRDLKLNKTLVGDPSLFDLGVGQNGDVAIVAGTDNLAQSIRIKFSTERGTLPLHPTFGVEAPIGRKVNLRSLIAFQLGVRGSLLQDRRISRINQLRFQVTGNVLTVNCNVQIADLDQAASVAFETTR